MTDASDTGRRKTPDRRQSARRGDAAPSERRGGGGKALVVTGPAVRHDRTPSGQAETAAGSAAFAAQLLGQPGIKRGLKGGPEVIDGARSAYLETEYLGRGERRAPKGVIAKTEI